MTQLPYILPAPTDTPPIRYAISSGKAWRMATGTTSIAPSGSFFVMIVPGSLPVTITELIVGFTGDKMEVTINGPSTTTADGVLQPVSGLNEYFPMAQPETTIFTSPSGVVYGNPISPLYRLVGGTTGATIVKLHNPETPMILRGGLGFKYPIRFRNSSAAAQDFAITLTILEL